MKKILIVGLLSACTAGVYAQGTLVFYNNFSDLQFQIYAPNPASPSIEQTGDTASQAAISGTSGTPTVYGGQVIGGSSFSGTAPAQPTGLYSDGNLFTAQIYASPAGTGSGSIPAFGSLSPVSQYIENFTTSGGVGNAFLNQATLTTDPGIPGTGYDNSGVHGSPSQHILNNANVAVAAWYNMGGTITSLAAAQAAGVPNGESTVVLVSGLGEPASVETASAGHTAQPTTPTEPYGLQSFSLAATPEPSTIAMGVMGACAFLARRRKK
jgi:hypothetical protein